MNLGSDRWHSKYICDKCGEKIRYIGQKGFVGINHYYKSVRGYSTPHKDFDLCSTCEKKLREWLKDKEIEQRSIASVFPIWEEK